MPDATLHKQRQATHRDGAESPGEDGDIIAACVQGDRDGQRAIYKQHSSSVYRLMFRLVGRDNAEDLTQQVFLRLFCSIGKFSGRSSFSTWLYRLATNEALQFLRRERRRPMGVICCEPVDGRRTGQLDMEDAELMDWAVSQLATDDRTVFVLKEMHGLSYHEIALVVDIAEGTVASRLNRARRALLELLRPVVDH
ncbi:MAG: RNA polymerase sigma factor [Planctomycetaceae bacterium]|nr:RNA polymerase sigma factor [Planctomycetaceae bacterium]